MPVLPIIIGADHPVLRAKAKKVPKVSKEIQQLIKDMEATVRDARGAGLAAPQIGQSLRVCLAMLNGRYTPLINPEIIWRSAATDIMEEGCLSLPGSNINVQRPTSITVKYLDGKGSPQERKLEDFDARVVQHEIDHLDGVLIVDYLEQPMARHQGVPSL